MPRLPTWVPWEEPTEVHTARGPEGSAECPHEPTFLGETSNWHQTTKEL